MDRPYLSGVAEVWQGAHATAHKCRSRPYGKFSKKDLRAKFEGYTLPT